MWFLLIGWFLFLITFASMNTWLLVIWIALPVVGMLLFTNLALGVISRVAPQMNIFAVGFPITLVVGILGVALMLPTLEQPFAALVAKMLERF